MANERTPYRPGSGTEGRAFMARFCDRCVRDEAFQRDEGDSCEIAANSVAFRLDEPGYPEEWIVHPHQGPCCTAFEPIEDVGIIRDLRQMALGAQPHA